MLDQVAASAKPLFEAIGAGGTVPDKPPLMALLRHRAARPYLQKLADASVEVIEDDLESGEAGAHLHLLGLLAPHVDLPGRTVRHWMRRLRELAADGGDDEADLWRPRQRVCKQIVAELDDDGDGDDDDDDDD